MHLGSFHVYAVVIQKNKTDPSLREEGAIHQKVFEWLVTNATRVELGDEVKTVVVVTDSPPLQKKRSNLRAAARSI